MILFYLSNFTSGRCFHPATAYWDDCVSVRSAVAFALGLKVVDHARLSADLAVVKKLVALASGANFYGRSFFAEVGSKNAKDTLYL